MHHQYEPKHGRLLIILLQLAESLIRDDGDEDVLMNDFSR
jgi:hypothetical protein